SCQPVFLSLHHSVSFSPITSYRRVSDLAVPTGAGGVPVLTPVALRLATAVDPRDFSISSQIRTVTAFLTALASVFEQHRCATVLGGSGKARRLKAHLLSVFPPTNAEPSEECWTVVQ